MPGIALVGIDVAGGLQLGLQVPWFKVNGSPAVVVGDRIAPHGEPPHSPMPTMVQGTSTFRLGGIATCRAGHLASCGHPTTGRPFFRIP